MGLPLRNVKQGSAEGPRAGYERSPVRTDATLGEDYVEMPTLGNTALGV
ncbi:hypothetical protein QFZ21_004204 [Microbacterium sp. W4I20]|nr:hypothetical protein [Microbacterium sp. W4I20]